MDPGSSRSFLPSYYTIMLTYVLHQGRSNPGAEDTYQELEQLSKDFEEEPHKRRAIKIYMGDFNGRLARAYDFTGKRLTGVTDEQKLSEVAGCWSV